MRTRLSDLLKLPPGSRADAAASKCTYYSFRDAVSARFVVKKDAAGASESADRVVGEASGVLPPPVADGEREAALAKKDAAGASGSPDQAVAEPAGPLPSLTARGKHEAGIAILPSHLGSLCEDPSVRPSLG